jgi:hypothetical protein
MNIDEDKIREEYANVKNFCRQENIGQGVYSGLKKKTTKSFRPDSSSWKAYKKLKSMGYILEDEKVA